MFVSSVDEPGTWKDTGGSPAAEGDEAADPGRAGPDPALEPAGPRLLPPEHRESPQHEQDAWPGKDEEHRPAGDSPPARPPSYGRHPRE